MFQMGQLSDCEVRVEDEVAVITAGHRRFRAAKYCNEHYEEWLSEAREGDPKFQGHRSDGLMCKAEPRDITDLDRTFRQLNQGDVVTMAVPLNPMEMARTYKRLVEHGVSMAEIGRRVHKSAQQVANTLCLIEAPKELQEAVERGETSATAASRVAKASPEKQAQAVESARRSRRNWRRRRTAEWRNSSCG
jgi:ParB-like chromosome segregation protein Spo0J